MFLDSRKERRHQCNLSDQTYVCIDKGQMVTNQNIDELKLYLQVQNACNRRNVNKRYICRASPTGDKTNTNKG